MQQAVSIDGAVCVPGQVAPLSEQVAGYGTKGRQPGQGGRSFREAAAGSQVVMAQ